MRLLLGGLMVCFKEKWLPALDTLRTLIWAPNERFRLILEDIGEQMHSKPV